LIETRKVFDRLGVKYDLVKLDDLVRQYPQMNMNNVGVAMSTPSTGVLKAREGCAFGLAAEAVTPVKQRRIARLALDYVARHHLADCPCRFDVVSIQVDEGRPAIEVFQNAFDA